MHPPMTADHARELRRQSIACRDQAMDRGIGKWAEAYRLRIESLDKIIERKVRDGQPEAR